MSDFTMQEISKKLADFGAHFPHITLSMESLEVPVVFNLNSTEYVESVSVIGFLPLLQLLVLMVVVMVYFCIVKFSSESKVSKRRCCTANICCHSLSGVFIINISLIGIGSAMFLCTSSSDEINSAISNLNPVNSADTINKAPDTHMDIKTQLKLFGDAISGELSASKNQQKEWTENMELFMQFPPTEFPDENGNEISRVTGYISDIELYRYWTSIALFSLYILIIILSFIGICMKSKCMIIGVTCALFFALVLCLLSLSAQLVFGVALSDYCVNPTAAQKNFIIKIPDCEADASLNNLQEFKESVDIMGSIVEELTGTISNQNYENLNDMLTVMSQTVEEIIMLKQCEFINAEYDKIPESLCSKYIVGWWLVLLCSFMVSLIIFQLLFLAPCIWRSFDLYRDNTCSAYEETTPFVRGLTFQRPVYPQRQSVTLSFLRQSNDDLNYSSGDKQPPPFGTKKSSLKENSLPVKDGEFDFTRVQPMHHARQFSSHYDPRNSSRKEEEFNNEYSPSYADLNSPKRSVGENSTFIFKK